MTLLLSFAAVLLGAILGSFLNALSFRYNTGRSIAAGRSRCMHCGHELNAFDLVPFFSFLLLRARCRYCKSKISWQYPLVEAVAAVLSLLVFINFQFTVFNLQSIFNYSFWLLVWMTLLFVVIYDIRHTIIPWSCSILLAALALLHLYLLPATFYGLIAGPILASPLFLLSLISRGTWMGWGDSALELSLGWFLGLTQGLTALMLGFWIGAAVGIILLLLSKLKYFGFTIKSEMPFAPFLILGAALALFFHVDFFSSLSYIF